MKKVFISVLLLTAILFVNQASAQRDDEDKRFSGGFGIEGSAVVGNKAFRNAYSAQFGISGRFAFRAGPGWITVTPGANYVHPKSGANNFEDFSIHSYTKAGYKYIFLNNLFIMGEAGYAVYTAFYEDYYGEFNADASSGFCLAPTIGLNLGAFEVGAKYEFTKLAGGSISNAGLRLGFNF